MIFSSPKQSVRRGFTLVEMLVVVAIIGILAGLISVAAVKAMQTAKRAVITVELSELDRVLKAYKDKYGEYPPDGTNQTDANNNGIPDSFERHFQRVFPKANLATEPGGTFPVSELGILFQSNKFLCDPRDVNGLRTFFQQYTPRTALAFWLGGMQEDDYSLVPTKNPKSRLIGFSANPLHPLSDPNPSSRLPSWYEFKIERINDPTGTTPSITFFRDYRGNENVLLPYVYFRAEINQHPWEYTDWSSPLRPVKTFPRTIGMTLPPGSVKAYFDSTQSAGTMPGSWINPTSYQILFCGFDNTFGEGNWYPVGKLTNRQSFNPPYNWDRLFKAYDNNNTDDITNFAGGTIGDKMP